MFSSTGALGADVNDFILLSKHAIQGEVCIVITFLCGFHSFLMSTDYKSYPFNRPAIATKCPSLQQFQLRPIAHKLF
jgi:hypothetical protein